MQMQMRTEQVTITAAGASDRPDRALAAAVKNLDAFEVAAVENARTETLGYIERGLLTDGALDLVGVSVRGDLQIAATHYQQQFTAFVARDLLVAYPTCRELADGEVATARS